MRGIRSHCFRVRQIHCNQYSTSRRISIPIPPPFPVVQSCPEPTCSCTATPAGLEIDHDQDLNGTMAPYAQQVLISTGQRDWRSRIEEDGLDQGWGILGSRLKKLMFRTGKYADPYNNIVITNSSFIPSTDKSDTSRASALLFPSFKYIPDIPLNNDGLDRFVRAFLLPLIPHRAHEILPADKLEAMKRLPELQPTFKSMKSIDQSPTVLICGHGGRDKRCGVMGPLLESEFSRVLKDEGYTVGDTPVDRLNHANIGLISHIGGHKYAGNVIIYIPRSLRSNSGDVNALAGKAIWYGRVEPKHVQGIIRETILNGRVIKDHFRGDWKRHGRASLWASAGQSLNLVTPRDCGARPMIHDCSFGIFMNNTNGGKVCLQGEAKATIHYIFPSPPQDGIYTTGSARPLSSSQDLSIQVRPLIISLASPLTSNQRITPHTIKLANVGADCEQILADMDTKFPSSCRLCDMALDSPGAWRQHAKSELHIHNLRLRVAEPGSTILPLQPRAKTINPDHDSLSEDDSDETDEEHPWMLEFDPEQCIFCGEAMTSFDDNILHMSKAHSFIIPYQGHLDADITSLLRYLYLEIFEYHRCILCSTRRRTVEGIQHHMMAKGHCRFDITSHTSGFYNFRQVHNKTKFAGISPLLRLSHVRIRGYRIRASDKHPQSRGQRDSPLSLPKATDGQGGTETEDDKSTSAPCAQLLRLSRGDQEGLARLSNPELRSLLAIRTKHIGQLRRKETNAKLKLEKAGNITLTSHFRADTSKRFRGPWG